MNYKSWILLLAIFIVLIGINFQLTGFLVQEGTKLENWTFSNSSEYTYNSSLINLSSGVKLKLITTIYNYTNTSINNYILTQALYNPSDKLSKVDELDGSKLDVKKGKFFDIVFSESLDNGDNISFYLKDHKDVNFYICLPGELCTSGFGNASYDGENDQWINITLSGLSSSRKVFGISTDEKMKVDYITSNKSDLVGAYYNPSDKLNKVEENDNKKFKVKNDKIFNVFFNDSLDNGYMVNFYLEDDDSGTIKICQLYNCSVSYGNMPYPGVDGWYNVSLNGLSSAKNSFTIDTDEDIKINYINSTFLNQINYSITNSSYPESGSLETRDLEILNLNSWREFSYSQRLNGQNITYEYSTDSGNNWSLINNKNLSNLTSKKIRFRINLTSNITETPIVDFVSINYTKIFPSFKRRVGIRKARPGNIINITLNVTNTNLISNAVAYVKYPNGTIIETINLSLNNQSLFEGSWNSSGFISGLYYIDSEISSDYINLNQRKLIALISSTRGTFLNNTLSFSRNETFRIDSKNDTKTILDIRSKENLENITLSIVEYTNNVKKNHSKKELGRYIDIEADNQLNGNISSVVITIYYNQSEIDEANLDENSLKIHYYNETSEEWEELNSIINTTGKYLSANLSHFSTYGIFGDEKSSGGDSSGGSPGGSSGGSSGGGGSRKSPPKINNSNTTEDFVISKIEVKEKGGRCIYDTEFYMEGLKGIVKNKGNCKLNNLKIELSPNLENFISLSERAIGELDPEESFDFMITKKVDTVIISLSGGLSDSEEGEINLHIPEQDYTRIKQIPIYVKVLKNENNQSTINLDIQTGNIYPIIILIISVLFIYGIYSRFLREK